ncbi:MAG: thiamine pyrophosphate-dependent enzyme [Acidobacteriota bacterium]|nr:thiamine pyrophosphate-dependent enzyme [Acidobacteriota bacterium]
MPENPLLPNVKLKELYALMQRVRALIPRSSAAPRFEAILAATLMHVEPGDFVSPPLGTSVPALLATERTTPRKKSAPKNPPPPLPTRQRLATVAGIAHGLKLSGAGRFALYYTDAGPSTARTEAGWAEALSYAARAELPLLLVCADATGGRRIQNPQALSWPSMSKLAKQLHFPVLTVDGSDAVAVYRVMQESANRARLGDGIAVLWCVLPRPGDTSAATDPLRTMRRYLAARNLFGYHSAA